MDFSQVGLRAMSVGDTGRFSLLFALTLVNVGDTI